MSENIYDVVIIGAGVAGYSAALKAARLGKKTALIEENQIGGTCLNRGCIPTKKLISESRMYQGVFECYRRGCFEQMPSVDGGKLSKEIEKVTDTLRNGLAYSLKHAGVVIYHGQASLSRQNCVDVKSDFGILSIESSAIIIATGSHPDIPKIPGLDSVNYKTTDTIFQSNGFEFDSLTIIGGGVVGIEFADALSMLGKKICVIEKTGRILENMPAEVSAYAERILKKKGVEIICNAEIDDVSEEDDEIIIRVKKSGKESVVFSDALLLATGRAANCKIVEDSDVPIKMDGKLIVIDNNYRTNTEGVYSIGDVSSKVQLAYLATKQGEDVIEYIVHGTPCAAIANYPNCVFMTPEIVSIGLDEEAIDAKGKKYIVGRASMSANGKAVLENEADGFIKILMDADSHKIIGGQLVCKGAVELSELLIEYIEEGVTGDKILSMVFPHPSIVEDVKKAISNGLYMETK